VGAKHGHDFWGEKLAAYLQQVGKHASVRAMRSTAQPGSGTEGSRVATPRQWLALAVALVLLNAAVTFHNVWPTPWIITRHEFSIDLSVLLLGLVAYSAFVRPPPRAVWIALTVLLLIMSVGRYAQVTAPALYGRPVNFYWDAQHLPKVVAMLATVAPVWLVAALVIGLVTLLAALSAAFYWSLTRVAFGLSIAPMRRALGVLAVTLVGIYTTGVVFDLQMRHWFSFPVSATYRRQVEFLLDAYAADTRRELPIESLASSDLGRVAGADVLLVFLESYGAVTYDAAAIAQIVEPRRAEFAAAAVATGRRVVSAFVESTTFGGGSWLAHSSLLSGFDVRDDGKYNLLLTQKRETLPALFTAAGYRSIGLMPGMRNPWPEGAFYSFEAIYGERDLDYRGPDFGWWRIPDQYALAKLDALELRPAVRRPVFVFFPTINTHIPFLPVPPYQPDWGRVLGAEPFDPAEVAASVAQTPDWTSLGRPYADSIAYTFSYLGGYLRERAGADFVLLVVGDHQPVASVSGVEARWDVPVHIVTSRDDVATSLLQAGFIEGAALEPTHSAIATMSELTTLLLRAFDSGDGVSGYGGGPDTAR
jgi:hypothetical protein